MTDLPAWLLSILATFLPGFTASNQPAYNGYVEAEFIYVAPSTTRRITRMAVDEGQTVTQDQFLFEMDTTRETASLRAAIARKDAAEANLHNLQTGGRVQEIRVVKASLEKALSDQALARTNLARSQSLFESQIVTTARVDSDRAALERANAQVSQLRAQLEVAELPARDEQLVAAQATLEAANAQIDLAQSALSDLTVTAPVAGLIESLYFDAGEVAGAGTPVLALLPPSELKVIFYIPEPERMNFAPGQTLNLTCDGCAANTTATITRMSSDPQFTPPIIYSRDERTRLVFRANATLNGDVGLLPGQPVTLTRPK